jgi:opacity protein-like surface antigen
MYYNMKRNYTLLSIFFITLISFSAKAQDVTYVKSYLGIYGGISNPVGDFGSTNYSNNQAGFAHRGITFSLDAAVYLYKNLAVGATVSYQDHPGMSYNNTLAVATGYTTVYDADETDVTSNNNYRSFNFMIGPQYSFTFKKFILDLRADAGIIKQSSSPEVETTLFGVLTQTAAFYQNSAAHTILAYGGNVGLRYKFSDSWSVGLKGSYIDSQGFDVTNTGRTVIVGRNVTHVPISIFQTTVGLTLNL